MNTYKMSFATNTLTITKAFEDACANPASTEYQLLTQLKKDFPSLTIVRRTHKSPSKYKNANGETTACNQFKNLTYQHMEQFINGLPASESKEKVLAAYNFLRFCSGGIQTNAYKTVREWFVAQFPEYRSNVLFYIENDFNVISIDDYTKKKEGA